MHVSTYCENVQEQRTETELDVQSTAGDDPYSVGWHMIVDIGSEENTPVSEIVRLRPVFVGSFFKNKNQSWTQVIKLADVI